MSASTGCQRARLEQLDREIPDRVRRALSRLLVASQAPATQQFGPRGKTHATSRPPAGVILDGEALEHDGSPLADRSLFDHHLHAWNQATSAYTRRLACYQAELAVDELVAARRQLASEALEARLLRAVGVDSLELAVKHRVSLQFVRYLRSQVGRDDWFGQMLDRDPTPALA